MWWHYRSRFGVRPRIRSRARFCEGFCSCSRLFHLLSFAKQHFPNATGRACEQETRSRDFFRTPYHTDELVGLCASTTDSSCGGIQFLVEIPPLGQSRQYIGDITFGDCSVCSGRSRSPAELRRKQHLSFGADHHKTAVRQEDLDRGSEFSDQRFAFEQFRGRG